MIMTMVMITDNDNCISNGCDIDNENDNSIVNIVLLEWKW